MNEADKDFNEKFITVFKKLPPKKQEQVLNFIDFLIWKEQKRNLNYSDDSDQPEIKNDN